VVRLDRTGTEIEIPNQVFQAYEANGDPIYEITGMPLRLGWAVTIHRAQGLTVDKAFVDVGSIMAMIGESKHGLAYVALSRTRTLQGLQIFGWNDDAVFCAPAIKPWI
jgi:ATP-dependent exoDNAse (exonuclease V) alpha subunit